MHKTTARYLSRSLAIQAIYYYKTNPIAIIEIERYIAETSPAVYKHINYELMHALIIAGIDEYDQALELYTSYLKRETRDINLIEQIILVVAATELKYYLTTPTVIIINEYIELAKLYGAEDSYKFINSLLDKLAKSLRNETI